MTRVISSASTSLDGFIAFADNTVGPLFDWYNADDAGAQPADNDAITENLTEDSAAYWRSWTENVGVLVVGRELFDFTDGWHGHHPLGVPVVVVTHRPVTGWDYPGSEDFTFVGDVDEAYAKAREIAGDKDIGVAAGTIARQFLERGWLDAVAVDLVPVVLGGGRPYFGEMSGGPYLLGDPVAVIRAPRVTHLMFEVQRS